MLGSLALGMSIPCLVLVCVCCANRRKRKGDGLSIIKNNSYQWYFVIAFCDLIKVYTTGILTIWIWDPLWVAALQYVVIHKEEAETWRHMRGSLSVFRPCYLRGCPKISIISWVYKPYTFRGRGGGLWKWTFFCTLLPFWPDFYYFPGNFGHSKNVDVYSFLREGVLESVWFVHLWKCWHLWMAPKAATKSR